MHGNQPTSYFFMDWYVQRFVCCECLCAFRTTNFCWRLWWSSTKTGCSLQTCCVQPTACRDCPGDPTLVRHVTSALSRRHYRWDLQATVFTSVIQLRHYVCQVVTNYTQDSYTSSNAQLARNPLHRNSFPLECLPLHPARKCLEICAG